MVILRFNDDFELTGDVCPFAEDNARDTIAWRDIEYDQSG